MRQPALETSVILEVPVPSSGTYYVVVTNFTAGPDQAGQGPIPDSFTQPYRLTVQQ